MAFSPLCLLNLFIFEEDIFCLDCKSNFFIFIYECLFLIRVFLLS